jgi:regulator of nucleoside diphosphate kinase
VEVLILERTLTELDHVRLLNLVRRDARGDGLPVQRRAVDSMLDASDVVPSRRVPPDVVTMYSQVLLQNLQTRERSTLTLCYPADAEPAAGFVSVLSPLGSGVLGLRVGSVARWSTPAGDDNAAEILAILFQPESSGDYSMSPPRAASAPHITHGATTGPELLLGAIDSAHHRRARPDRLQQTWS